MTYRAQPDTRAGRDLTHTNPLTFLFIYLKECEHGGQGQKQTNGTRYVKVIIYCLSFSDITYIREKKGGGVLNEKPVLDIKQSIYKNKKYK